jgi:hypothetical protein
MELPVGGEGHPLMDERVVAGAGGGGHCGLRVGWEKITILSKIWKIYFELSYVLLAYRVVARSE